jgi:hypothetical protein
MGPLERRDRRCRPPGPGVPARGRGSGPRSVAGRPLDAAWGGVERPGAHAPGSALDGEDRPNEPWALHPGCPDALHQPGPTKSTSLRTTPMEAITGLGADRAGSDPREIDPPAHRPGKDEPGLAGAGLAVCRLAASRDRPARAGPDPRPGRPAAESGHSPTAIRAFLSDIHQASVARFGVIDRSVERSPCARRCRRTEAG